MNTISPFFTNTMTGAIPIYLITPNTYQNWFQQQLPFTQQSLKALGFDDKSWNSCGKIYKVLCQESGKLKCIVYGVQEEWDEKWNGALLSEKLISDHTYYVPDSIDRTKFAIAWGLGIYSFNHYKSSQYSKKSPKLYIENNDEIIRLTSKIQILWRLKDWINMPASDMTPPYFAHEAKAIANSFAAEIKVYQGQDLEENFPLVHAVGKASNNMPCVIDMQWHPQELDPEKLPKITLIGKGITFDTGGLDIKSASNMYLMHKDMAGAAHALGLACLIMAENLKINLRVILPMAENSVDGKSYRPSDIIKSRSGVTVEIGDTDAEGRLVLADAITLAEEENPDYIFDFSTLTGAARVALGTDIAALFCNDKDLAKALMIASEESQDPLWELPLWQGYEAILNSTFADIRSCDHGGYAGAITAALFLKKFIKSPVKWAHIDMMAWNISSRPGRPEGAEIMSIYSVFHYLEKYR